MERPDVKSVTRNGTNKAEGMSLAKKKRMEPDESLPLNLSFLFCDL